MWFINHRLPLHLVETVNAQDLRGQDSPEIVMTKTFLVAFMLAIKWLQDESMPTKNWFVVPRCAR